jgi:hypothetical protein
LSSDFDLLSQCKLRNLVNLLNGELEKADVDHNYLISLMDVVQSCIALTEPDYSGSLTRLLSEITGICSPGTGGALIMGRDMREVQLIHLISASLGKVGVQLLCSCDMCFPFPGRTNCFAEPLNVRLEVINSGLFSTGLWLPQGLICEISNQKEVPGLKVQIGIHGALARKQNGPWRRWPNQILSFAVPSGITPMASPFGGMIYIIKDSFKRGDAPIKVMFRFSDVCEYPFFERKKPKNWPSKLEIDLPLAELSGNLIVLTLPTEKAQLITDLERSLGFFDDIIASINRVIGVDDADRTCRAVFDPDLDGKDVQTGYPTYFGYDWISLILGNFEPTPDLFAFFAYITLFRFEERPFSTYLAGALSIAVTLFTFRQRWKNVDRTDYCVEVDFISNNLRKMIEQDSGLLSVTHAITKVRSSGDPDVDNVFWQEIGARCRIDVSKFLLHCRKHANKSFVDILLPEGSVCAEEES